MNRKYTFGNINSYVAEIEIEVGPGIDFAAVVTVEVVATVVVGATVEVVVIGRSVGFLRKGRQ